MGVFTALFFAVSCDSGVKFTNPNDTNADITDSSDSDDIEISDADMSDNDSDIADSGSDSVDSTPDDGDSQLDDMNNTDPKPDDADPTDDYTDSADDEDTIDPDVTDTGETVGETRVTDCTGLPENASWNTVSAIVQTWNGEKWVPSSVASFNLEGSEDECRFKCDINYGWNGSICVADVKNAYCDAKPENSVWNDGGRNGTFAQTWNGSSWTPASHAAVHSTSAVECGFVCVFGYVWDGSYCEVAPTQTVECTGLPMNGAEWNTASTITQTWDGEKWVPESTTGVYNENPSSDECRFKCKEHYSWKNSECAPDKKNSPCMNLPTNGQWNTAVSIEQTWNGSDWQPSTTGVYSETASTKECRFVCKTNYKWNASTSKCDPEINVADCTGKPTNAVWNGSGKFEQTWTDSGWYPAGYEATYSKTAGICTFICDTGFIWDETSCISAPTREAGCQDKPENTVWNTVDKITQTYNGSDWEPSTTPVYNEEASTKECRYKCAPGYNCNGQVDEVEHCDAGLSLTVGDYTGNAEKLAKAMGVCVGLVSAEIGLAGEPITEMIDARPDRCNQPSGDGQTTCTTEQSPRLSREKPYYENDYQTFAVTNVFGTQMKPEDGSNMLAVLSTGQWNSPTQNESIATLGAGDMQTASKLPEDWLNMMPGCAVPKAPSCGGQPLQDGLTNQCAGKEIPAGQDPIMLTLKMKVPANARAFEFSLFFMSIEYPGTVCDDKNYNDFFVALLDSTYNEKNPNAEYKNPYDKNLAKDDFGNPVGVDLAPAGLFKACNPNCGGGGLIGGMTNSINKWGFCTGDELLNGTGFGTEGKSGMIACSEGHGGTGWLRVVGNVEPNEEITLRLALWEQGTVGYGPDHSWDSTVLLDGFKWLSTPQKAGISQY